MKLLALEIKRVLKTKRTWILIAASVLLAVFMAYIPSTFVTAQKTDESGNYVEITGKDAINYYKSNRVQGIVTPEILRDAVRRYQEVYKTYDSVYGDNIPSEVYYEKLSAYQPYIRGIKEALADRNNGMSPVISDISIDKVGEYYDLLESRLAPIFSPKYQTGADDIIRYTKNGKKTCNHKSCFGVSYRGDALSVVRHHMDCRDK